MEHRTGAFQGSGAVQLFRQSWAPDGRARAVMALVHGVGDHSGRYASLVRRLVEAGIRVEAFDLRGHGRSPGRRGHITAWSEYREDLHAFLGRVEAEAGDAPVFLYGHSMGSMIVLDYLLRHDSRELAGVIISGAPIDPVGLGSPLLIALVKALSRIWPSCPLSLGLDPGGISTDPEVVRAYREDPLVHGRITPRWGTEALATADFVAERAPEITRPILVVHGENDPINSADGVRGYFEDLGSSDKELAVFSGALHEPHNDRSREEIAETIARWITARAG